MDSIRRDHRIAEAEAVARLRVLQPDQQTSERISRTALRLAQRVRAAPPGALSAESFLRSYGLTTPEGVALMCVAEALLRIPDPDTADALIRDKLSSGNWNSASAADWALMLTGTLARWHDAEERTLPTTFKRLIARLGEPVVRAAVRQAMRILAGQFVVAETIEAAVARAAERRPYCFSFDMLGEAARTAEDAASYMSSYARAIRAVKPPDAVSIKLSALHARFEEAKRERVFSELVPRVRELASFASERGVGITLDAEESERLELTLDLFELLSRDFEIGLAVQAYQKRALSVCEWLVGLRRRISVRLVKGAYWDGEI
ncbi:MAG TPA: proline dehydrogenase family protein, partial [Burkholderiales bacterium]|nr:proline dehydrogenase family protein [Burkholderiales bacterium]